MVFTVKPVYRLEIEQEYNHAALVLNTPHFEWSGGGGVTLPAEADLLALGNAWKEAVRPHQAAAITYAGYKAVQVGGDGVTYDVTTCRQVGGAAIEVGASGSLAGTSAGNAVPPGASLVVSFRTGLIGKSRHGRQYIAGLGDNLQVLGTWTSAAVAAFVTSFDTFLGVYGAGGTSPDWTMVIFSRVIASGCKANPLARHHPLVHVQAGDMANAAKHVTGFVVDDVVRSTRTRELGKGA